LNYELQSYYIAAVYSKKMKIMSKTLFPFQSPIVLIVLTAFLHVQCGSYQGTSYYYADGIYSREIPASSTSNVERNGSQRYYQQYFNNLSDEYGTAPQNVTVLTDTENYTSDGNTYSNVNNQPWGAQTQRTTIHIYDNTQWGFSPWNWNFSPWGGYYDYWWNRPYRLRPSWGWGFYDSFYSPFYTPFYDPFWDFHYGNRWAFSNYGSFYYGPQFNNRYWNRNVRVLPRRSISRVASRRGEKNYESNRNTPSNRLRAEATDTKNSSNVTAVSRYNAGRSAGLFNTNIANVPTQITSGGGSSRTVAPNTVGGVVRSALSGARIRGSQSNTTSNGRTIRFNSSPSTNRSNYQAPRTGTSRQQISTGRSSSSSRSSGRSSSSGRSNGGRRN
jgi:hypothetical protein